MHKNMRLIAKNSGCKHLVEKPQMFLCTFGFYDCHGCEQQINDGELYFLQRRVVMTLAANWWMKPKNHWEVSHKYDTKLCRNCVAKKHPLIDFEPFICRIVRKDYLVIADNYSSKPQTWCRN